MAPVARPLAAPKVTPAVPAVQTAVAVTSRADPSAYVASAINCVVPVTGMVDVIFADVAQPDQARIIVINAQHYLKNGGGFVFSIKANCIDSTADPNTVFANQVQILKQSGFKPKEQITLEPYERDHAVVCGLYKPLDTASKNK